MRRGVSKSHEYVFLGQDLLQLQGNDENRKQHGKMNFGNVMHSILRIQNRDVRRKFFKEMIPEILAQRTFKEQIESPEQCTKSMCFRETFWRV